MARKRTKQPPAGTFAERLTKAWEATGWSLTEFSGRLAEAHPGLRGTSSVQLGRYMDGPPAAEPPLNVGRALADVLRVSPAWLMLGGKRLPEPDGLTDYIRPLWRIDGPMADEHLPESPKERDEARKSFEEGFRSFADTWGRLSPTVQVLFGNLLARRMLAARHEGDPWREPFWRGQEAKRLGEHVMKKAGRFRQEVRVSPSAPLDSPEYSDLLLRVIADELADWRDQANPKKEDKDGEA